jgi:ferredoxin
MRITVDRERCVGAGQCVLAEPELFDQSEQDGRVVLLNERPAPELAGDVEHVMRLCPSQALGIDDEI